MTCVSTIVTFGMKRRERRLLTLSGGLAATVLFACATASGTLAQSGKSAVPAPATASLDDLPAKTLASPRKAMQALRNPSEPRSAKRVNLCSGDSKLCWGDGVAKYGYVGNQCDYFGSTQGAENAYVGTTIADDARWPATGDNYWGHLVVFYNACTTNFIIGHASPPPNTEFALDAGLSFKAGRTRCYTTFVDINVNTGLEAGRRNYDVTGANTSYPYAARCDFPPDPSNHGYGLAGQTVVGTNGCPLPGCNPLDYTGSYMIWEVVFPLRSSKKLDGIGSTNHKLVGTTESSSGNTLFPDQWVNVNAADIAVRGKRKGGKIRLTGAVGPSSSARNLLVNSGESRRVNMRLTLLTKRGKRLRPAGAKNLLLSKAGTFVTTFRRPRGASGCQVEASWNGNKMRKPVGC